MLAWVLGIYCCLLVTIRCVVVSSFDWAVGAEQTWMYFTPNGVGLSMQLKQVMPELNNQLFQKYILNSQIGGSWGMGFDVVLHNQDGYKYNCTLMEQVANSSTTFQVEIVNNNTLIATQVPANQTIECVFDMNNDTFMTALGEFSWDTTNYYGMTVGWDNQGANFTDGDYMSKGYVKWAKALYNKASQPFFIELADRGNEWEQSGFRRSYDHYQPALDCANINLWLSSYMRNSPGLTQSAGKQWYDQIDSIQNQCGYFTVRAVVFPNTSELTIQNLLSQNYTSEYIKRRFNISGTDYYTSLSNHYIKLNDVRLVADPQGLDGLTNSFAAAIWLVEFMMEWILAGGYRAALYNPIGIPSFQSVLGQAPTYHPTALYYGLLTFLAPNFLGGYIMRPVSKAGISSKIKAYGFDGWSQFYILLLNKDPDPTLTGEIQIVIPYLSGISCWYTEAPYLNSTDNITMGGYKFVGNNSVPQGLYNSKVFYPSGEGKYYVPIKYAQMGVCKTLDIMSFNKFPRQQSSFQQWRDHYWLALLSVIALLL